MKKLLIHVRYWGAFILITIGVVLMLPGHFLIKLGGWIGSKS